jgi:hypothetical protein
MSSMEDRTATKPKPWTVMLYMAAAINDQTEQAAVRDIEELQSVDTKDAVNVVVQIERAWPGYPQRYQIVQGRSEPRPDRRLSSGKRMTTGAVDPLCHFLRWTRQHAPAERYLLVLWGHAFGLGFGRDHGDALTMPELAKALCTYGPNGPIDLLGANACAMSYAEAVYQLRDAARFLVAPEITMPFQGWPYAEILSAIVKQPGIEARELGKMIVDRFLASFGGKDVALTLLDLGQAGALKPRLRTLSDALVAASENDYTKEQIANAFLDTAHGDVRPLIDLDDLCLNLASVEDDAVTKAAGDMRQLLEPERDGLIVHHRTDPAFEGIHGLGIFAPAVTGAADLTRLELSEPAYQELALTHDTEGVWAGLVYQNLKVLLDPVNKTVAAFVKAAGVASREDRTGVAQLLLSVNRAFARLQETAAGVKTDVLDILKTPTATATATAAPTAPTAQWQPKTNGNGTSVANGNGKRYLRLLRRRAYGGEYVPGAPGWVPTPPAVETKTGNGLDPQEAHRRDAVSGSLRQLEDALEKAEKTLRRVVTHATLGLGDSNDPGLKPGGGLGDSNDPGLKPGGGLGDSNDPGLKPGGGLGGVLPRLFATGDDTGTSSETKILAGMYREIASTLYELEDTVTRLENAALPNGAYAVAAAETDAEQTTEEVERSFRELDDALASATETSSWILRHPTYGLGPGRDPGLGSAARQQLASAGGLGPKFLRLL